MKKEIFRMINVITNSPDIPNLDDMNLHIHEGEIVGLIPVNGIGIQIFLQMFTEAIPVKFGKIYINNKPVNNRRPDKHLLNKIYILNQQRKLVDSLSVLENIYVLNTLPFRGIIRRQPLLAQYSWLMEDMDLYISPDLYCEKLTELERCMIEVFKAITQGALLIVLYGMSDVLGAGDLLRFKEFLSTLASKNYSFLYICSQYEESISFCDKVIYMKDGKDIQSFDRNEIDTPRYLKFCRELFSSDTLICPERTDPLLKIRHLPTATYPEFSFHIFQGECLVVYDETKALQKEFMDSIYCNHGNLKNTFEIISINSPRKLEKKIGTQIAIIGENPLNSMLFWDMSYIDNFCLRMESKIQRISVPKHVKESVQTEYHSIIGRDIYANNLYGLSPYSLYKLIYYRVALLKPKAVFIIQPFYNTDIHLKKYICDLIHMLQEKGISVIILSADFLDSMSIANRRFILEDGILRPE